ncbi:MAG: DUF3631 domain-containing protein [Actinomycetota bacterium]
MNEERTILATLLSAAVAELRRYVVLTPEQADVLALWAAHTHVFTAFHFTPYLNIHSATKQSGKTRLLEVLRPLCAGPVDTDGMTPAALVRLVDARHPTLLLDESDAAFKGDREYAEALRGILNSGFRSRGNVTKCVGEGANMTTREFSTFCPKAIAGIGQLPDTVADRSIPIELRRRAPGEKVAEFFEEEWENRAPPIAGGFADTLEPKFEELVEARPDKPEGISDRAKDAWKALLAVADLAGGEWPERARHAAQALCGHPELDEQEIGIRLLGALRSAFEDRDTDKLTTSELLRFLHAQSDEPWADWSRGSPIPPRRVADLLRPFDIRPKKLRVGEDTVRGYERTACEDAFSRYLPLPPDSVRNIRNNGSNKPETAPFLSGTEVPCSTSENAEKRLEQANVPLVPDRSGGDGGNGPVEEVWDYTNPSLPPLDTEHAPRQDGSCECAVPAAHLPPLPGRTKRRCTRCGKEPS